MLKLIEAVWKLFLCLGAGGGGAGGGLDSGGVTREWFLFAWPNVGQVPHFPFTQHHTTSYHRLFPLTHTDSPELDQSSIFPTTRLRTRDCQPPTLRTDHNNNNLHQHIYCTSIMMSPIDIQELLKLLSFQASSWIIWVRHQNNLLPSKLDVGWCISKENLLNKMEHGYEVYQLMQ